MRIPGIENDDEKFVFTAVTDEVIFRNFKTFHVNRDKIGNRREIYIAIPHRNVMVKTDAKSVLDKNWIGQTRKGEVHLHYEIAKWDYVAGDTEWLSKIYADYGWELKS